MLIAPYHPNLLLSVLNYVSLIIFFVETPTIKHYEKPEEKTVYDYIIVGAGSAGCVLAKRLSADNKTRVLLLEAGGPEEASARVPYFTSLLQFTRMDWNYRSQPQKNASYGLPGRVNDMPRGKTLGGTSSMNYMVYSRGNKYDYDKWVEKYGLKNWSYSEVEVAFKEIETSLLGKNKTKYRGYTGEVPVSYPNDTTKASRLFLKAGRELGYRNGDYNAKNATGFSRVQRNAKDGERWSSSRAFITDDVRCRVNLHISLHSHVTKILIENKTAIGVQYQHNKKILNVTATREVILSAGAIGSPQLLMLSGIGPAEDLGRLNIPLVENLPVGQKMYDHLLVFGIVGVDIGNKSSNDSLLSKLGKYALNRTGPLSYPAGVDSVAFVNTSQSNISNPDMQFFLVTPYPKPLQFPACGNETPPQECHTYGHAILRRSFLFTLAPILLRPTSSGFVKLNSSDPFDPPIIDPQLLSNNTDFETMVEGVNLALRVMNTTAMRNGHVMLFNYTPACENYTAWTEDHIECMVRSNSHSGWHPCCTAPMGTHQDAVLDARLRVYNVTRLRVVDASSMPYLPSGNIHVPVMMIAHKAAMMIMEDNMDAEKQKQADK
ncbi:alcohol dehydrogenase [acceptor]-like isoform X2 [Haemaphysalis longicornis]